MRETQVCTGRTIWDRNNERKKKEAELNSRRPNANGKITWNDFTTVYSKEHLKSLKETSKKSALSTISVFRKHLPNAKTIGDADYDRLSTFIAELRESGTTEQTIAKHLRTLHSILEWARKKGHIAELPEFPTLARVRKRRAKGRPLTNPEFVAMLRATSKVVLDKSKRSYRRLIIGLWLSGLRLEEALELTWGEVGKHETALWIDTSGKYPLLGIVAESEKGFEDRLLPIVPEFARWLLKIPKKDRKGFVFPLVKHRFEDSRNMRWTSKVISMIGKKANVTVNARGKFASAQDLRRTFGLRWSSKVMPADLMILMRHESIETTMTYYAIQEAEGLAKRLWETDSGK